MAKEGHSGMAKDAAKGTVMKGMVMKDVVVTKDMALSLN
jgi:hypothetical protein